MVKTSLADAKAHLSELVDRAQHQKQRVLILRHGKPAAALVPVEQAGTKRRAVTRSEKDVRAFFDAAARCGDPAFDAVSDLLRGRR